MTKGQRQGHLILWTLLTITILLLLIKTVAQLNFSGQEVVVYQETQDEVPVNSVENDILKVEVLERKNQQTVRLVLKTALKYPSVLVYEHGTKVPDGIPLGAIGGVGVYEFPVSHTPLKGLVLYDALKEVTITEIQLTWD